MRQKEVFQEDILGVLKRRGLRTEVFESYGVREKEMDNAVGHQAKQPEFHPWDQQGKGKN